MQKNATFLFYDLETSGLNPCFDQILQFAAIRTDLELNELERHEFLIQLNADTIPSPQAMIIHRIGIQQCLQGESEYTAICKIHQLFNTPGTITLGYNTLGFDDEFLRFAFYRNLLKPYTHQYANQCHRMDIYPMTILYYLFNNDALTWPVINNKTSLRLEHLSESNKLSKGQAHNAMVDVEATLALAHKLRKHRQMWDYLCGYFDKNTDITRMDKLPISFEIEDQIYRQAILVKGKIGSAANFMAPVLSLGQHQHYKNQTLWLRLDLKELQNTTEENINELTYVYRKRAGEQEILLPPEERFSTKINQERQQIANENLSWLQQNKSLLAKMTQYHQNYQYANVENVDIDAALYEIGFPSSKEESLFVQFHQAGTNKKIEMLDRFNNHTRKQQALRILMRNFLPALSAEEQQNYKRFCQSLNAENKEYDIIDYRSRSKLKVKQALDEIANVRLQQNLDNEQIRLLDEYEKYLHELN